HLSERSKKRQKVNECPTFSPKMDFLSGKRLEKHDFKICPKARKKGFFSTFHPFLPFLKQKCRFFEVSPPTFSKKESEKTEKTSLKP
ncbi:MAG: hypothetical protein K5945_06025, partial [Bacteroidaceae bacterium]|nr:hypothetical protein [Bacteroidaceae bacterium]